MPDNNENSQRNNNYEDLVTGTPANTEEGDTEQETNNQTAENVSQNDPEKNKKLAEVTMSEQLRETYSLTLKIPRIFKGVHTNQWFHMEVNDDFYETNYPVIAKLLGDEKFGRFAGFRKGRFFVEKVVERGGIDGFSTELTLNPIAPSLAVYSKMQQEATKALIEAINYENRANGGGSTGGAINASGVDCNPSDTYETHHWGGNHRQYPPVCTPESKTIRGNSSRQYATDTAQYAGSSQQLVEYVAQQCSYVCYADNPKGEASCPEKLWTGGRPIGINCADSARLLKCILDVNGYQSITCHIPGHFFNAIWENGGWTICDICQYTCYGKPAYGHANHEDEGDCHPIGTWDNPMTEGFTKGEW